MPIVAEEYDPSRAPSALGRQIPISGNALTERVIQTREAVIINDPAVGPDSYAGLLVSTLQGSTETTFYVLAVYFGAVQIRRIRHGLATGLTADFAGICAAVVICLLLFGE